MDFLKIGLLCIVIEGTYRLFPIGLPVLTGDPQGKYIPEITLYNN